MGLYSIICITDLNLEPDAVLVIFADDTTIIVHDQDDRQLHPRIERAREAVLEWFFINQLSLNGKKM